MKTQTKAKVKCKIHLGDATAIREIALKESGINYDDFEKLIKIAKLVEKRNEIEKDLIKLLA